MLGIIGSFVMRTLPPRGGNINGKLDRESSDLAVQKECLGRRLQWGDPIGLYVAYGLFGNHMVLTQCGVASPKRVYRS